jgi:hypothetical protein
MDMVSGIIHITLMLQFLIMAETPGLIMAEIPVLIMVEITQMNNIRFLLLIHIML